VVGIGDSVKYKYKNIFDIYTHTIYAYTVMISLKTRIWLISV